MGRNSHNVAKALWSACEKTGLSCILGYIDESDEERPLAKKRETPLPQRLTGSEKVDRGGLEPPTPGFSVQCSTN